MKKKIYMWICYQPYHGSAGKESACNAGNLGSIHGFDPWVGVIRWRRERLPTPVFWPGEFHGLYSPPGRQESDRTQRLSLLASQSAARLLLPLEPKDGDGVGFASKTKALFSDKEWGSELLL